MTPAKISEVLTKLDQPGLTIKDLVAIIESTGTSPLDLAVLYYEQVYIARHQSYFWPTAALRNLAIPMIDDPGQNTLTALEDLIKAVTQNSPMERKLIIASLIGTIYKNKHIKIPKIDI